jgi:STE24 endopeptidase
VSFDPAVETARYLATLSPEAHAKAIAYTQGGHWLILFGLMVSLASAWVILKSGLLTRLRRRIEVTHSRPLLVSMCVAAAYLLLDGLISLPWTIYTDWWRQRSYGLSSQAFGDWAGQAALSTLLSVALGSIFLVLFYVLIRRTGRQWWVWAGGLTMSFILFVALVAPVVIEPLFNQYKPAPAGPVRVAVEALARDHGIRSDRIFVYDGSRQSNAYTANVSGLAGSARIAMSDAMFAKNADVFEVRAVVGHEMGHYVRHHLVWIALVLSSLALLGFFLVDRLFEPVSLWMGAPLLKGLSDPAGLPVIFAILAVLGTLGQPVRNSLVRMAENDADQFSLSQVNEPDGLSRALVKTIEYRASSPTGLEEFIFYDHPSVERRISRAMTWKASHSVNASQPAAPRP